MKKKLITLFAIAATVLAFTAAADAGHKVRYLAGYDHCGRPVYCYKYVPSHSFSYGHIFRPSPQVYGHDHGHTYGYSYSVPRPHGYSGHDYRPSYGHGRPYCR